MHFAHAVFRAVETRAWLVRGANTGISGVIDPAGRVVARLPTQVEGTLAADLYDTGAGPPYAHLGNAPVLAALAVIALAPALAARRRRVRD